LPVRVEQGDCREVIPKLGVMVDAVVTDPPYEIGFMGREWDQRGVAFDPKTWRAVHSVMRPGGFLLAFGGTRTHHRVWSAIEDAGFILQDTIMWMFGSGFPKRRDMLKPAFEPICLAYKPGGKRTLQVDECRIPGTKPRMVAIDSDLRNNPILGTRSATFSGEMSDEGRWPANVCHDGSEEVIGAFAAFGERDTPNGRPNCAGKPYREQDRLIYGKDQRDRVYNGGYLDTGTAARFFYCAKADKQDRWGSRHPTVKPVELMKWLVPLVTPLTVDGRPGLSRPICGLGNNGSCGSSDRA
jgi:hypothetical protein